MIKTPCIGICSTGIGDSVCRGCKRYAHEVIDWNAYSQSQKALIERRLSSLLTQIIQNRLHIIDESLMRWQISTQPVDVPKHRNLYCQAYALIKAGASQIRDPQAFGFKLRSASEGRCLAHVCGDIDAEFYILSEAHYQRCFKDIA